MSRVSELSVNHSPESRCFFIRLWITLSLNLSHSRQYASNSRVPGDAVCSSFSLDCGLIDLPNFTAFRAESDIAYTYVFM